MNVMPKTLSVVLFCLILLSSALSSRAEVRITAFDRSSLTWSSDSTGGYYRVEWSPAVIPARPDFAWCASWSNFWSFGSSNALVYVALPAYFRVAHATNAWTPEAVQAIGTDEVDYAVSFAAGSFPNVDPGQRYAIDWLSGTNWVRSWNSLGNISATDTQQTAYLPGTLRLRLLSTNAPAAIEGMSWIFDGTFAAGPPSATRSVTLSGYYMDRTEVTEAIWLAVYDWAVTNGYDLPRLGGELGTLAPEYPVTDVTWFDAAAWCNARSEMAGLSPHYFLDPALSNAFRNAFSASATTTLYQAALSVPGYRLPTELEWERGARGFLANAYFPWGGDSTTSTNGEMNCKDSGDLSEFLTFLITPAGGHADIQAVYLVDMPPDFDSEGGELTTSYWETYVEVYPANGWGLVDMAGNVWEWCTDWHRYAPPAATNNWSGPAQGTHRVIRGGSFGNTADRCTVYHRGFQRPDVRRVCTGFRCVRIP
jgi:formylglycine-generating enzyme required for sulfatase activity